MNEIIKGSTYLTEFNSINEFYKYITETSYNEAFKYQEKQSITNDKSFTGTESYEEAVKLLKNGWPDMSNRLTKELKNIEVDIKPIMTRRNVLSPCGYQAVVPLYLNGIPNNMVNNKMMPKKEKIVNITKNVSYSAYVTTEQIIDYSVKTLMIVKKLESQGYRCNLNIILGTEKDRSIICKVRIKSATEKLNVSKIAFPMVNPSMLRRLFFRYMEVYPYVTSQFTWGYGRPMNEELKNILDDKEYFLPNVIEQDIQEVKDLENLY